MDKLDNRRLSHLGPSIWGKVSVCLFRYACERQHQGSQKWTRLCLSDKVRGWCWRYKHLLLITCFVHFQLSAKLRMRKTIRNHFFHFIGFGFIGKNKWYTDYYATQSQVGTVGIYSLIWLCDCLPSTSNKPGTHIHTKKVWCHSLIMKTTSFRRSEISLSGLLKILLLQRPPLK